MRTTRRFSTPLGSTDRPAGCRCCNHWIVRLPGWYRAIGQPLRCAVAGAFALATVGALYGVVESVRDYPLSSWPGVILYVAMIGAVTGFLLGLICGAVLRLVRGEGAG